MSAATANQYGGKAEFGPSSHTKRDGVAAPPGTRSSGRRRAATGLTVAAIYSPFASAGTGKPRLRMRAAMPGSRPRNFLYASAGSTVLPIEKMSSRSRLATALSYGPPAAVKASQASAESVSDQM